MLLTKGNKTKPWEFSCSVDSKRQSPKKVHQLPKISSHWEDAERETKAPRVRYRHRRAFCVAATLVSATADWPPIRADRSSCTMMKLRRRKKGKEQSGRTQSDSITVLVRWPKQAKNVSQPLSLSSFCWEIRSSTKVVQPSLCKNPTLLTKAVLHWQNRLKC